MKASVAPLPISAGNIVNGALVTIGCFAALAGILTAVVLTGGTTASEGGVLGAIAAALYFGTIIFCLAVSVAAPVSTVAAALIGVPLALLFGFLLRRVGSWWAHALATMLAGAITALVVALCYLLIVGFDFAEAFAAASESKDMTFAFTPMAVSTASGLSALAGWLVAWKRSRGRTLKALQARRAAAHEISPGATA